MIYALSLNPALDKSVSLPRFDPDAPNRVDAERVDVGGKGVNVARVARTLGGGAMLVGFDYRGTPAAAAMQKEGVPFCLIPLNGEMRVNLKIRETETGRTLEINERGMAVTERDIKQVMDALLDRAQAGDWVSLSGSLPPGAPEDTYASFCRALRQKGCHTAVDCDGASLRLALRESPSLIKPNAQEFFALTGLDAFRDETRIAAACRKLAERVCLSMGEKGALLISRDGARYCPAAPVKALGVQGAGDSMLAALLVAFSEGMGEGDALRFASAAAGASVARPGTLLCRREDVESILSALPPVFQHAAL